MSRRRSPRGLSQVWPWPVLMLLVLSVGSTGWREASADFEWSFPRDHWVHRDFRIEWWYFTGHLESVPEPIRNFGYQFTVFKVGLSPEVAGKGSNWSSGQLLMGHFAVSDLTAARHHFSEVVFREHPSLAGFGSAPSNPIAWMIGPPGTNHRWSLAWTSSGFAFAASDRELGVGLDLQALAAGDPVLQGPNGYSRKAQEKGAASLYYSFPRLQTNGTLTLEGVTLEVRGESWMDKEFSSTLLSSRQSGWDWFSLRFDDGTDLMLYRLRKEDGSTDFQGGTRIDASRAATQLGSGAWTASPQSWWTSPATGGVYPVEWRLEVDGLDDILTVEAAFPQQENVSVRVPGIAYWEGSVRVLRGNRPVGRGYLEMTGYVPGGQLPM